MPVSAIIRCHRDHRIFDCIADLDNNSETHELIAVLTNDSLELAAELRESRKDVKLLFAPYNNLSRSTNIGIEASKNDKLLILDSDLRCSQNALDKLDVLLEKYEIVKSKLEFNWNSFSEKLVSELRAFIHSLPENCYCPGLALRKDIKEVMGGHFFNDKVWWTEDAEFNFRRQQAGVDYYRTNEVIFTHLPENMPHDLNGAYKIGRGKYSQVLFAGRNTFEEELHNIFKKFFKGQIFQEYAKLLVEKGLAVSMYSLLWDLSYYLGYYRERLQRRKHSNITA
ncbi:MAG: glycosyltransferase [Candidatus Gracilibacteria bacterium]|nr:glycosyltransferase [Candidatus Gracilibacteria bacterium]